MLMTMTTTPTTTITMIMTTTLIMHLLLLNSTAVLHVYFQDYDPQFSKVIQEDLEEYYNYEDHMK